MGKAKQLGVIDDSTPRGRVYTLDGDGLPEWVELVTVNDAKVTLRDESGEDIILSRDEWDETWAPAVTAIEDPEEKSPASGTPMPETQEELVGAVRGGELVMVPRSLLDAANEAQDALDEAQSHFDAVAEERRQAKDALEDAQNHYNQVSKQVLACGSKTGFPAGSPLAKELEESQ